MCFWNQLNDALAARLGPGLAPEALLSGSWWNSTDCPKLRACFSSLKNKQTNKKRVLFTYHIDHPFQAQVNGSWDIHGVMHPVPQSNFKAAWPPPKRWLVPRSRHFPVGSPSTNHTVSSHSAIFCLFGFLFQTLVRNGISGDVASRVWLLSASIIHSGFTPTAAHTCASTPYRVTVHRLDVLVFHCLAFISRGTFVVVF